MAAMEGGSMTRETVSVRELTSVLAAACGLADLKNVVAFQISCEAGLVKVNVTRVVVETADGGATMACALLRDWEYELVALKPVEQRRITAAGEAVPRWVSVDGRDCPSARRTSEGLPPSQT